jgi:PAS domain S-box-containing protein
MADTYNSSPESIDTLLEDDKSFEGFSRAQVSIIVTNPHIEDNPIVYVNQAFTRQTGYARSVSIGRNCRFLQGEKTEKAAVDMIRSAVETQSTVSVDILNYRANGEPFMNRLVVAPIFDAAGNTQYFMGIQKELRPGERDLGADRIHSELMEIQNRVQTDMSMIIGMIRQQSGQTSVPEDFAALTRRIETLQLLYEEMKLSDQQSNRDSIQMGSFISRLACAIAHVEGRSGVRVGVHSEALDVPLEVATRVGLVASELLANSFQHAFDRMDSGMVEIRMTRLSEGGLRLTVSDDGIGIPKSMNWPDTAKVGGRIISGLIEGLEGTIQLSRGAAGSFISIDVPAGASITE